MTRLLVIDDDTQIAKAMESIAKGCGCKVEIAVGADMFYQLAANWQPTHILLDLQMPIVDGVEILRHLGNIKHKAKIIVASGVDGRIIESVRQLGVEYGLNIIGVLLKPFRAAELRALLA